MKRSTKSKLGWIVAILVVALFLNQMGYLGTPIALPGLRQQPTTQPPTTQPTSTIKGIVATSAAAYDSLDISTPRTIGTNVNVYWYAYRGGGWVLLGSGNSSDVSVEDRDNNIVYAVISVPSGQSYYVDYAKIMQMNSRAQSVQYIDVDGDNVEEFVFRVNIADIPYASGTGKYTMPTFNVYLLTYDSSHTINSPSNQVAGTSKVTKYIEWYTTMSAEKKALAISKIVLVANTSATEEVTLKKLNIPGVGYLDGSSFTQDVLSSEIKWTYTISSQLYGADYLKLPANSLNKFEFTTAVEVDLSSSDIQFTLYIYYLTAAESLASLSDAVVLTTN